MKLEYKPSKLWTKYDTLQQFAYNLCIWHDGTLHPAKGHKGTCKWNYDGQVFYHLRRVL